MESNSKQYLNRLASSHKSKEDDRGRDRDRGRKSRRDRSRSRSDSRDGHSRSRKDRSDSRDRKEQRKSGTSVSRDRDRNRDRSPEREKTKSESNPAPSTSVPEKIKPGLPPISKRDVENCMDELELTMEKSRRSQEEKKLKLDGVNPTKEEVTTNIIMDYRLGGNESFLGARFIFECGIKLDLKPTTVATAAVLYHRFWNKTDVKDYDVCTIGATSVLIACKVENEKRRMRDLINVVHQSIERDSELLDMDEKYFMYKNGIVQAELFMMRVLEFQVTYDHPHRYLVHYLRDLQHWMGYECVSSNSIFRTAWSILQDFHHDPTILNYKPQELAIAAIDLSLSAFGAIIPGDKPKAKKNWKTVFYADFDENSNREIIMKMFDIYEKEGEFIPALVYSKDKKPLPAVTATTPSTNTSSNRNAQHIATKPNPRHSAPIPERETAMMSGMNPVPPPPPKLFRD